MTHTDTYLDEPYLPGCKLTLGDGVTRHEWIALPQAQRVDVLADLVERGLYLDTDIDPDVFVVVTLGD
jgi:hypothetical protein